MRKIDYNPNNLSHVPKSIIYWVSQGIVIDDVRYSIKEFKIQDGKLKFIIENHGDFYELDAPMGGSEGSYSAKGEYVTKNDILSDDTIQLTKSPTDNKVGIGLVPKVTQNLDKLNKMLERACVRDFNTDKAHYIVYGTPDTDERLHTPVSIEALVLQDSVIYIDYMARNIDGMSLWDYLTKDNELGVPLNKIRYLEVDTPQDLPATVDEAFAQMWYAHGKKPGETVTVRFDKE